jgi:hypothetical protein
MHDSKLSSRPRSQRFKLHSCQTNREYHREPLPLSGTQHAPGRSHQLFHLLSRELPSSKPKTAPRADMINLDLRWRPQTPYQRPKRRYRPLLTDFRFSTPAVELSPMARCLCPALGAPKTRWRRPSNNTIFTTILFPKIVAFSNSYLNDVRFHLRPSLTSSGKEVAYITLSSEGNNGIMIVDLMAPPGATSTTSNPSPGTPLLPPGLGYAHLPQPGHGPAHHTHHLRL